MSTDYDSPWKEALEEYFEPFMELLFKQVHRQIDWSRGYESLDKEFQQVVREAEVGRRFVLVNRTGNTGRARRVTFPYPIFEKALLLNLREVTAADLAPKNAEPNPADVLKAKLQDIDEQIAALKDDLLHGYSREITAVLREQEAERDSRKDELERVLAKQANPLTGDWKQLPNLADAIEKADDQEDAPLRVRALLRRAIQSISLLIVRRGSYSLVAVQVFFVNGICRSYLILHQTASNTRKGGSWRESLASVVEAGELDLRRREDAEALERQATVHVRNGGVGGAAERQKGARVRHKQRSGTHAAKPSPGR